MTTVQAGQEPRMQRRASILYVLRMARAPNGYVKEDARVICRACHPHQSMFRAEHLRLCYQATRTLPCAKRLVAKSTITASWPSADAMGYRIGDERAARAKGATTGLAMTLTK